MFGVLRASESAFTGMPSQIQGDLWTMKLHRQQPRAQLTETPEQAAGGPAPSSSSGRAPAAGGPTPQDVNMEVAAESSATSSAVQTLEAEDDASAKRQKVAGVPILHESDVDVNVDAHKMVVSAAMPDDREQWTHRVIDLDKKY